MSRLSMFTVSRYSRLSVGSPFARVVECGHLLGYLGTQFYVGPYTSIRYLQGVAASRHLNFISFGTAIFSQIHRSISVCSRQASIMGEYGYSNSYQSATTERLFSHRKKWPGST